MNDNSAREYYATATGNNVQLGYPFRKLGQTEKRPPVWYTMNGPHVTRYISFDKTKENGFLK